MIARAALVLLATVCVEAGAFGATVDDFERAAAAERLLDPGCVLYDRMGRDRDCANQAADEVVRGNYPIADLDALRRHRDPRVRTLALVCLFEKGDPKLLPLIFELVGDNASTFPMRTPTATPLLGPRPPTFREILKTPQTVGEIAGAMISFYLTRAGYLYGPHGSHGCPGFAEYWSLRKDRTHLASWFSVQLDRATQGTSPVPHDRGEKFATLRSRLDALTGEDRLWYSLFVGTGEGGDHVFRESELVAVGKALGPDRLMPMIVRKAPASDPDLVPSPWPAQCGHGPERGHAMRSFVLRHASALLRPTDAQELLASPRAQSADWAIAAATLQPARAAAILQDAIAKIPSDPYGWEGARMAAALPVIAGASHTAYALDWFYSQPAAKNMTTGQEIFIGEAVERYDSGGRTLLTRLVLDRRFDAMSKLALRTLIGHVNTWLPAPLVEYPYAYVSDSEAAAIFAGWRKAVRDSVPRWPIRRSG